MTDITKCYGDRCDKKEKCRRYTAPAGHWQSYVDSSSCLNTDFSLFLDQAHVTRQDSDAGFLKTSKSIRFNAGIEE